MRLTLDELAEARGDLSNLNNALGAVEAAAVLVAAMPSGNGKVVIDLTVGQPVTITTGYVMPDHPLVRRPSAPPVEIVEAQQNTVEQEAPHGPSIDGAMTEQVAPKAGAERGAAPAADGLVTGPLTMEEQAAIRHMHSLNMSVKEICRELNRAPQGVGSVVRRLSQKEAQIDAPAIKAPDPAVKSMENPVLGAGVGPELVTPPPIITPLAPIPSVDVPTTRIGKGIPDDVRGEQRRIWQALDKVGYAGPFDAEIDLEVAEALFSGSKLNELSLDLGIDQRAMTERFRTVSACIRDHRGNLDLRDQADLLAVLRARVKRARA